VSWVHRECAVEKNEPYGHWIVPSQQSQELIWEEERSYHTAPNGKGEDVEEHLDTYP
jgi:hypothetical protein